MPWGVPPWVYFIRYSLSFMDLSEWFLSHVREIFSYYLLKYFLMPFLFPPSGAPILWISVHLNCHKILLNYPHFLFLIVFSLFFSASVNSNSLSSTSLIPSSVSCNTLLIPSIEFLGIVFSFFFFFLGLNSQHMEVPRLGVKSEL